MSFIVRPFWNVKVGNVHYYFSPLKTIIMYMSERYTVPEEVVYIIICKIIVCKLAI